MSKNRHLYFTYTQMWPSIAFCLVLLLLLVACDPAFRYVPKHLEGNETTGFSLSLEGIEISVPTMMPLLVQDFYLMSLTVENIGDAPIRFLEATFIGEHQTLQAQMSSMDVVIDPEVKVDVLLRWEVDQGSFVDALGEEPILVLAFRSGNDSLISEVFYQREFI